MEYYIVGDHSLANEMADSLENAKKRMEYAQIQQHVDQVIRVAPSFIFDRVSDFLQAIKADYIVVLIQPNRMFKFEILAHDPTNRRIIINDLEIIEVEPEEIEEIILDEYPLEIKKR